MSRPPARRRRPRFTPEAADDIRRIAATDRALAEQALRLAVLLHEERGPHRPLQPRAKTGDLRDCFKAPFGHDPADPSHRLVYRLVDGWLEVVEVVAVGPRMQDAVYLMAGLRLDRIDDPHRRSLAARIVHRTLRRSPDEAG